MAADILLYKTTHVPVGEDQKQHLELTRDVAATFEVKYGEGVLIAPEPMIMGEATRVMSLQDGSKKMSKSDPSEKSRVNLIDDADTIVKKIKKAKTDQGVIPDALEGLEGRPEVANLVTIYAALSGQSRVDVLSEFAGQQFGPFKAAMADVVVAHLAPITAKMRDLLANPDEIDRVLAQGNARANEVAAKTVGDMQRVMGFWR